MFERFTDRARRVVVLAQDEARLLDHKDIDTGHVLLGIMSEREGIGAKIIADAGLTREAVRQRIVADGPSPAGHMPFTPRAKKVLELSLREALQLGHNYIGTEHILLGLIREGEGVAAQVLSEVGLDLAITRAKIIDMLQHGNEDLPETAVQHALSDALREEVRAYTETITDTLQALTLPHDEYWALMTALVEYRRAMAEYWPLPTRDERLAMIDQLMNRFREEPQ